ITTPGDSNTFLSCGEDGTVRMFDIRTKQKCAKRDCREDVLIDCAKAITSISINPQAPYQLAVGCENSTVRVFDRRSLSTANHSSAANKMRGMVCKFRPDALSERTCRVTSLSFSDDGGELLVSYCADYLYLFNMRGPKSSPLTPGSNGENDHSSSSPQRSNLPLKRLRLRGDWSDTGPNARPESEATSTESNLMQRMSDMFVRWIEESFRANQRGRGRPVTSSVTSSSDCGRIFLWDKNTCEIVVVLQGDKHVVNCIQPHPFDPILASSGIDYDIKLWSPSLEYPQPLGELDEIIKRNEKMLEESRDTITVPASFMLRMLASLNHAR
ncbi:predicted protein, partial [Nematostella vectensis]